MRPDSGKAMLLRFSQNGNIQGLGDCSAATVAGSVSTLQNFLPLHFPLFHLFSFSISLQISLEMKLLLRRETHSRQLYTHSYIRFSQFFIVARCCRLLCVHSHLSLGVVAFIVINL